MQGLRVGIIGGGLGGLAAALALRHSGQEVVVFEQAPEFRAVGAGISLWPNGVKVLCLLGLGRRLAAAGGRMDLMAYADRDGRLLTELALDPLYEAVGQRAWPLARTDLQDMLADALGAGCVRFGMRCASVASGSGTSGASAVARFEDGAEFEFDLVVGADGTHSGTRPWVTGRPVDRRYVGYVNFNTVLPFDSRLGPERRWITWVGEGKRASVMPCGSDRSYVFLDIPMPPGPAAHPPVEPLEELHEAFGAWTGPVRLLLEVLEKGQLNRVQIHELPPLARWWRGDTVLLGDAVHTMAPDLGQGGCQALEDGWVLAHYLASTDQSILDALRLYEQERAPGTAEIVRRARKRSDLTHGVDPEATEAWYRSLDGGTGEDIIAGLVESVVTGPCR